SSCKNLLRLIFDAPTLRLTGAAIIKLSVKVKILPEGTGVWLTARLREIGDALRAQTVADFSEEGRLTPPLIKCQPGNEYQGMNNFSVLHECHETLPALCGLLGNLEAEVEYQSLSADYAQHTVKGGVPLNDTKI